MPGISIISTITQLNMGTWNLCRIGLIQLFIAGLNKAFTSWIGAVRPMGSWTSMIWILLLWNKDVGRVATYSGVKVRIAYPTLNKLLSRTGVLQTQSRLGP